MSAAYPVNPYASVGFQGVQQQPSSAVEPKTYTYIYNPPNGQLTAMQSIVGDFVAIQTDGDFEIWGFYISLYTSTFTLQLTDASGNRIFDVPINSGAFSQSASVPTVISPRRVIPAGGKILVDITDTSNATNPVQIAFVGRKLIKVH
jgi:hypothetical protein